MVYLIFLISSIFIAFLKPKQEQFEATEEKVGTLETEVIHYNQRINDQEKEIHRLGATAQKILNNVNHELRLLIGNVVNFAEIMHVCYFVIVGEVFLSLTILRITPICHRANFQI